MHNYRVLKYRRQHIPYPGTTVVDAFVQLYFCLQYEPSNHYRCLNLLLLKKKKILLTFIANFSNGFVIDYGWKCLSNDIANISIVAKYFLHILYHVTGSIQSMMDWQTNIFSLQPKLENSYLSYCSYLHNTFLQAVFLTLSLQKY